MTSLSVDLNHEPVNRKRSTTLPIELERVVDTNYTSIPRFVARQTEGEWVSSMDFF